MPTNTKSSKLAKQSKLHFRWYMAIVLVAIVAVVGILVVRFSNASVGDGQAYNGTIKANYSGVVTIFSKNSAGQNVTVTYKPIIKDQNGLFIYQNVNNSQDCMYLDPNGVGTVGTKVIVTPSLCGK